MSGQFPKSLPSGSGTTVFCGFHVKTQKSALRQDTSRKPIAPEPRKPTVNAVMVNMGVDPKRHQHVSIEQPRHASSSSASNRHTVSAVIGALPREIANPLRLAG